MQKRTMLVLGLLTVAATALGIHLLRQRRTRVALSPSGPVYLADHDDDDPFAEMIEEGAGLLGQMQAEAAELARRTLGAAGRS